MPQSRLSFWRGRRLIFYYLCWLLRSRRNLRLFLQFFLSFLLDRFQDLRSFVCFGCDSLYFQFCFLWTPWLSMCPSVSLAHKVPFWIKTLLSLHLVCLKVCCLLALSFLKLCRLCHRHLFLLLFSFKALHITLISFMTFHIDSWRQHRQFVLTELRE